MGLAQHDVFRFEVGLHLHSMGNCRLEALSRQSSQNRHAEHAKQLGPTCWVKTTSFTAPSNWAGKRRTSSACSRSSSSSSAPPCTPEHHRQAQEGRVGSWIQREGGAQRLVKHTVQHSWIHPTVRQGPDRRTARAPHPHAAFSCSPRLPPCRCSGSCEAVPPAAASQELT